MSFLFKKSFLGIDIGTSFIKITELSKRREKINLENYGEVPARALFGEDIKAYRKNPFLSSSKDIARAIRAVAAEAGIQAKEAAFSIPDFSTFFVNLNLPPMSKEELPDAVRYAARQYVPFPLAEVLLDWILISGKPNSEERLKILLAAVPKELVYQYQKISELAGFHLSFMEAEVFSLVRALIPPESKKVVALLDIGAQSTTISIIDNGILKRSYSFSIAGNHFTQKISASLGIDYNKAQKIKEEIGIFSSQQKIDRILKPLINVILIEAKRAFELFLRSEGKDIDEIVLSGGSANLPGLKNYIEKETDKKVSIRSPFSNVFYPPVLENELKKIGPSLAVSVGLALRGLE